MTSLVIPPIRRPALVAVSGGVDSVVLLHLLLRQIAPGKLRVLHFNHKLRGRQSDSDERFVRALAKKLKVKASFGKENVKQFARKNKLSLETAARHLRYDFFAQIAAKYKIRHLYLAHHSDDQVETFLQRLFRGTGVAGLTGMKPVTPRGKLLLHRPLLGVSKKDLIEYARSHGLKWRDDPSNLRGEHNRNRVRHELLPLANEIFNRDVSGNILRLMDILDAENLALSPPEQPQVLSVDKLRGMSVAVQRRVIHCWLSQTHQVSQPDYDEVEAVRKLIEPGQSQCRVNLKKGWHVLRSRGHLKVEKQKSQKN